MLNFQFTLHRRGISPGKERAWLFLAENVEPPTGLFLKGQCSAYMGKFRDVGFKSSSIAL